MKFRDLGLGYEEAGHGVQSAVRFEMTQAGVRDGGPEANMLKHLRTGLDMRAGDMAGLAQLLIDKGVITEAEYVEALRLAANEELARYEEHIQKTYGIPATFR